MSDLKTVNILFKSGKTVSVKMTEQEIGNFRNKDWWGDQSGYVSENWVLADMGQVDFMEILEQEKK